MKLKLYIEKTPKPKYNALLKPYYDVIINEADPLPQGQELVEKLKGIDVAICGTARFNHDVVNQLTSLKYIASTSAGYDGFDVAHARAKGIRFSNNAWAKRDVCAEHAIALMLAVAKMIPSRNHRAKSGQWQHGDGGRLGLDMFGKTLGIIGAGSIGQDIARKLMGFNMRVLYHNRKRDLKFEEECNATYTELNTLLQNSDFVTTNTPLTDQTKNLMNLEKFRLMKPTAIYINISRGPVTVDQDLLTALKEGLIWGAGIDVLEHEQRVRETGGLDIPTIKELFSLDNLVVTPHCADMSIEGKEREIAEAVENAIRFAKGEELLDEILG